MNDINDVIIAQASRPGVCAVSMIRLSGKESWQTVLPFLVSKIINPSSNKMYYRKFMIDQRVIDDLTVCFYKDPNSYTGENSVEIFCHGGPAIVRTITDACISKGARLAEAGEFSRRALSNQKITLLEAEGILAATHAQVESQLDTARMLIEGDFSTKIKSLRQTLLQALAFLEARIDFPDEGETSDIELKQSLELIKKALQELYVLTDSYHSSSIAHSGLKLGLCGPPNVGKSSLFNRLIDKKRSLVTEHAGTTRDYIESQTIFKGRLFNFFDTAGIRSTTDEIEQKGIEFGFNLLKDLHFVLIVIDQNTTEEDYNQILKEISTRSIEYLVIKNKSDLNLEYKVALDQTNIISVSEDKGIDLLKEKLIQIYDQQTSQSQDSLGVCLERHYQLLEQSKSQLQSIVNVEHNYDECLAYDLKEAINSLSEILGEIHHEQVLDKIFQDFCIGK